MSIEEQDVDLNNNDVELEDEVDTTTDTAHEGDQEKPTETPIQKKARLKRQLKQLYKNNPELQDEQESAKKGNINSSQPVINSEEIRLIAQGFSDEKLERAKLIQAGAKALGKDITLSEATADPMFKAWEQQEAQEVKRQKAQLGASGAAGVSPDKPVAQMTKEEHQEFFKKRTGA